MSASLRDLKVWQEAVALAAEVVTAARRSARREIKIVTEALMTTALEVAARIAEGTGFHDPESQQASYRAARQSLLRLETQLAIARQAGLIEEDNLLVLSRKASSVARLLGGYLVYLERQTSNGSE
jgi:four helix bundle protein